MSLTIQSAVEAATFAPEVLEEAKTYNGRRVQLRKLVDTGSKPIELLDAHTQLMLENRKIMKGALYTAKLGEKVVHLIGTSHIRLIKQGDAILPETEEGNLQITCEIIHPIVMKILNQSQLYVELNMKDLGILMALERIAIEEGLINLGPPPISPEPLPRLERTKVIEDMAMYFSNVGLDMALIEQQHSNSKTVYSLESPREHIDSWKIQDSIGRKDPKNFLCSIEYGLEAIDAAQWGNVDSVAEVEEDNAIAELKMSDHKRDERIASRIFDKFSSGEEELFAIGISHLAGILSLLKARGVQTEQIVF